jgi:phenylpropionate dioxygenase-like ring-hydroxylating dioxygenase large terminal subunit
MSNELENAGSGRPLFQGFAGQWTPVELARRVKRGRALGTRLAGEKVALFRDSEGRLGALLDRCPHRGVELSRGRVTDRGTLECPFHGWEFSKAGECERVPWCDLADQKRERLSATALPVREAGGLVWVFTGADARGTEPDVPEALAREDGWARFVHAEEWKTHWTRAMENMLDYPHLPVVHRSSIGRGLRKPASGDASLELRTTREPFGMTIEARIDGVASGAGLEWRRPNGMVLILDARGRRMRQHVYCVPVDERTTRMILVSTRDFGLYNPLMWLFDRANRLILGEDRSVVESSDPPAVPRPAMEKSVSIDAPTLAFRRWYFDVLVSGGAADVPVSALVRSRPRARAGLTALGEEPLS